MNGNEWASVGTMLHRWHESPRDNTLEDTLWPMCTELFVSRQRNDKYFNEAWYLLFPQYGFANDFRPENLVRNVACPESVFPLQTCFLQQCTFVQTWNQVREISRCFISTGQNGSYVIRQNNINQKNVVRLFFPIKRKKLFGRRVDDDSFTASVADVLTHSRRQISKTVEASICYRFYVNNAQFFDKGKKLW